MGLRDKTHELFDISKGTTGALVTLGLATPVILLLSTIWPFTLPIGIGVLWGLRKSPKRIEEREIVAKAKAETARIIAEYEQSQKSQKKTVNW